MTLGVLTEHLLEFLTLKGGCIGLSGSTLVQMPHCSKSYVTAQMGAITMSQQQQNHCLIKVQ